MKTGEHYIVKITDNDINGNGIARIENFVIFILHALKDEELEIEITNINKRYANAKIIEFIKKSNKRCDVACKSYSKCGGCAFLHVNKDIENEIKLDDINKLFNKNIKEILTNNEFNYRNKATFHIKNNTIGYYSEKTHDIVQFDDCLILDNRINEIYKYFKKSSLNNIDNIIVRVTTNEIMVIINGNLKEFNYKELVEKYNINSLYLNDKLIYGNAYILEIFNNLKYTIYPNAFFQINYDNMKILYDKVREYAGKGNKLIDLYCGTGTISLYLSDNFKNVLGIEINKEAILNANINKKLNNITNVEYICGDASILKKDNYDVIVLDPPRSGLSTKLIDKINDIEPTKIVYVSCNYKTLKRDIDLLNKYNLTKIECVNMFSKTKHIEVICLLEKI